MENETNLTPNQPQPQYMPPLQQPVPNATAVLVLGILSIVFCWCYGIIGLVLGIIALVLANKGTALYQENPAQYTEGSFKNLKAGKVCSIVGLSISALYLVIVIFYIVVIGVAATSYPWQMYR
ncbi:MAG: CCC motif membrane protein [Bacteroidota bacterium]